MVFGYWDQMCKYKAGMIKKLMESFNIDASALSEFSVFDPNTLEVQTGLDDKDNFLECVEADLGINQGWIATVGVPVDIGHVWVLGSSSKDPT